MTKGKHLVLLIFRVLFIIMCFFVVTLSSVLTNAETDKVHFVNDLTTTNILVDNKNGAEVNVSMEDGKIAIEIIKSGSNYNDLEITIFSDKVEYDVSFIEKALGDKAKENEEYINAMKEGPWNASYSFRLMKENGETGTYTVVDPDNNSNSYTVMSDLANTYDKTNNFKISKDESVPFTIVLGSDSSGSLKEGIYNLEIEINISSLYNDNITVPKISFAGKVSLITDLIIDTLKKTSLKDIFSVSSWLSFYGIVCLFGALYFLWKDLRSAIIVGIIVAKYGFSAGVDGIKQTFVNGQLVSQEKTTIGGSSGALQGILAFMLAYFVLTITLPLRIIYLIIDDIIHLFIDDKRKVKIPVLGNILGSLGLYMFFLGFVIVVGKLYSIIIGAIILVVGIILMIIARKMSNVKDLSEYDD